jgi:hypothetical protein
VGRGELAEFSTGLLADGELLWIARSGREWVLDAAAAETARVPELGQ